MCHSTQTLSYLGIYTLKMLILGVFYVYNNKTHDSESQGQEEAGHTRQTSELVTRNTAVKIVNASNNLPLKLSLSYQGLSTF